MQLVDAHGFATLMLPITTETWCVDDSYGTSYNPPPGEGAVLA